MSSVWDTLRTLKGLIGEAERQTDILAETPKSVSGMTRILRPQIERDFPDFSLAQFINKAENFLAAALSAVSSGDTGGLADVSEEALRQVENRIADNRKAGIRETYTQIKVHQTEVANYRKSSGSCVITFQSAVEHYHYREKDGRLVSGDRERKEQTRYNTELVYIQDERLAGGSAVGTICPNCGAPVSQLGNLRCEYCGLAVTPVNLKVWKLHSYYEVDYHHV